MTPIFIAGPCVIESADLLDEVACELVRIKQKFNIEIYFKAFLIKPTVLLCILIVAPD